MRWSRESLRIPNGGPAGTAGPLLRKGSALDDADTGRPWRMATLPYSKKARGLSERFNLMIVEFPGSELRSRGPQKAPRCLLCRMLPVGCSGELPWIPISAAEVLTYKINMNFHPPMRRNSCSRLDAVQGQERLKKAAFCDSVAAQKHENEDVVEKDPVPKGGSFQAYYFQAV
jgi:hypothetical protein